MGIKAGIRVHLWYRSARLCSDIEMRAWLSGCAVDMHLFNQIQINLNGRKVYAAKLQKLAVMIETAQVPGFGKNGQGFDWADPWDRYQPVDL